jgi:hypothetical protein
MPQWYSPPVPRKYHRPIVTTPADISRGWQPYNVTWVALNARSPAERSVTYAVYSTSPHSVVGETYLLVGCSNLGGVYGNQVFRANDRPLCVLFTLALASPRAECQVSTSMGSRPITRCDLERDYHPSDCAVQAIEQVERASLGQVDCRRARGL